MTRRNNLQGCDCYFHNGEGCGYEDTASEQTEDGDCGVTYGQGEVCDSFATTQEMEEEE